MATRLINIVSFTNVAAGATVSLPHGLNENGTAVVPDICESNSPSASQFTIDANSATVTVKNEGGAAASIDVLAMHWHSVIRQLGGDPGPEALSIQPWVMIGGSGILEKGQTRLVFRPGAPDADNPGPNVYTDWATLYDRFLDLLVYGNVLIEFDSRFSPVLDPEGIPACQIPAGVWNMAGAIWTDHIRVPGSGGVPPSLGNRVVFAGNAFIDGLQHIHSWNGFTLSHDGTAHSPIRVNGELNFSGTFCRIFNTMATARPLIQSQGFMALEFQGAPMFIGNQPGFENAFVCAAPLIDYGAFSCEARIHRQCMISENAFIGTGVLRYSMAELGPVGPNAWVQPAAAGSFFSDNLCNKRGGRWQSHAYNSASPYTSLATATPRTSFYAAQHNDIVPVDTSAAGFQIRFPTANRSIGEVVTVKDVAGFCGRNAILILASGVDVIESPFLATPFGSRTWVSDGLGNWRLIKEARAIRAIAAAELGNFTASYDTAHVASAPAGGSTMTLPPAALGGRQISVVNTAIADTVTVVPTPGDTIIGGALVGISQSMFISDGLTTWIRVA